jgi:integrase
MRLNEIVLQYVAFRKSMGDDFTSAESLLRTFCRRVGENIELEEVTADKVQTFLAGTGSVSGYWRRKYDVLRGLYRYAISRGFIDRSPLPRTAVRAPRFKPYIYTVDELRRLLDDVSACLNPPRKLEPHTLRAILLLLYGAGLRVSEAVALTTADVDVVDSVITVRNRSASVASPCCRSGCPGCRPIDPARRGAGRWAARPRFMLPWCCSCSWSSGGWNGRRSRWRWYSIRQKRRHRHR